MLLRACLLVLFCSAGFIGAACAAGPPASDLDIIRGSAVGEGFAHAVGPRVFEFPRDHGPHPEFRHEWWYVTGNLESSSGERYGFELTFFRIALRPPGHQPAGVSAWRAQQLYVAHFAVTDVSRGTFQFVQKRSRAALGLAGAQAEPFRVWLDDWLLGVPAADAHVSAGDPASREWVVQADGGDYSLTLDARPLIDPVLNGQAGLSLRSADSRAASYYYSIPRVAVHGTLTRGGHSSRVSGLAWLDREWGSGSLGADQQGWDWFALQMEDGATVMFYNLRNRDGSRDPHSAGTWVDPTGRVRTLLSDQVLIDVTDHWVSPRHGKYPSRWHLRVPAAGLDVEVRPVLADQELDTHPRYWEGAVNLRGKRDGRDTAGRGYVELVGYGE